MKPFSSLVTFTTNSTSSSNSLTSGTVLHKNGHTAQQLVSEDPRLLGDTPVKVVFKEHECPVDDTVANIR